MDTTPDISIRNTRSFKVALSKKNKELENLGYTKKALLISGIDETEVEKIIKDKYDEIINNFNNRINNIDTNKHKISLLLKQQKIEKYNLYTYECYLKAKGIHSDEISKIMNDKYNYIDNKYNNKIKQIKGTTSGITLDL